MAYFNSQNLNLIINSNTFLYYILRMLLLELLWGEKRRHILY